MNTKKYALAALALSLLIGIAFLAPVKADEDKGIGMMVRDLAKEKHERPIVVQISASGNILLRGTVESVAADSLMVKTWGGTWKVNVSTNTKLTPETSLSQFKAGDFVGVQGQVSQAASLTIDARLVRNWTEKMQVQTNQQQIKEIMKAQSPKNWEGTASNTSTTGTTLTLTIDDINYTVNVAAGAKIVDKNFMTVVFGSIKNGDKVRVWGPSSGTTITAYVVRDVSL